MRSLCRAFTSRREFGRPNRMNFRASLFSADFSRSHFSIKATASSGRCAQHCKSPSVRCGISVVISTWRMGSLRGSSAAISLRCRSASSNTVACIRRSLLGSFSLSKSLRAFWSAASSSSRCASAVASATKPTKLCGCPSAMGTRSSSSSVLACLFISLCTSTSPLVRSGIMSGKSLRKLRNALPSKSGSCSFSHLAARRATVCLLNSAKTVVYSSRSSAVGTPSGASPCAAFRPFAFAAAASARYASLCLHNAIASSASASLALKVAAASS
mmetsp:Transcript_33936/g.56996  ORF Transcript_33936/g.56996 Transcript_33936/m.56996 type:complete len:272 (+) Transcript_33936:700-1515(+)